MKIEKPVVLLFLLQRYSGSYKRPCFLADSFERRMDKYWHDGHKDEKGEIVVQTA